LINIQVQADINNVDALVKLIEGSGLAANIVVEDLDDQNLKPMTATDFYKRINASNLAQKENRLFTQKQVENEVQSW